MTWAKQHESTGGQMVIDWDSLHANFRQESQPEAPISHADGDAA